MIVVIDSNVWLSELGLNSLLGSAVRFFINQNNARIGLPEVIRLEVEHNFRNQLKESVYKIENAHRQLLGIFGVLREISLPTDSQIEDKVAQIFSDVGVELFDIEFSLKSARNSFIKTINKLPPSDKTQEFKDGVIWADCCDLLEKDDVMLVTGDKAFYESREYAKGLARNLISEASSKAYKLKIFSSLSELLKDLKRDVIFNEEGFVSVIRSRQKSNFDEFLERTGYQLGSTYHLNHSMFVTEKSNILYVDFSVEFHTHDAMGRGCPDGAIQVIGHCSFDVESNSFNSFFIAKEEFSFYEQDNAEKLISRSHYHMVSAGIEAVKHSIKYDLASLGDNN